MPPPPPPLLKLFRKEKLAPDRTGVSDNGTGKKLFLVASCAGGCTLSHDLARDSASVQGFTPETRKTYSD